MSKRNKSFLKFKKLNEIVQLVKNSNDFFNLDISSNEIDFFNLILKAEENKKTNILRSCITASYMYNFEDSSSILLIFSIPSFDEEKNKNTTLKSVNDHVINIIKLCEEYFTYIDYINLRKQGPSDQYNYLIIVKKLKEEVNE